VTTYNKGGQWSLSGTEDNLLFKTGEKKDSGKPEITENRKVDPDSEEAKAIFDKLAKAILDGTPKQPTDEEMFGHLVVTEEQVKKAEQDWENKIGNGYNEASKPIDPNHDSREWGECKSFKDRLTEEELNKYLQEEEQLNKK
jgi:hypothetical protein